MRPIARCAAGGSFSDALAGLVGGPLVRFPSSRGRRVCGRATPEVMREYLQSLGQGS
jgi:hypothetical protein